MRYVTEDNDRDSPPIHLDPMDDNIQTARFALFVDKRGSARVAKVSEPRSRCNGIT